MTDQAIVAMADQLRLDAGNLREADDLPRAELRAIADRIDWAAKQIAPPP